MAPGRRGTNRRETRLRVSFRQVESSAINGSYLPAARAKLAAAFPMLLAMLLWIAIPPVPVAADSTLQARIEHQVQREPRLEGTEVRVITDAGNIVLTGQVPLLAQELLSMTSNTHLAADYARQV
jgi:hypothetical protein